MVLLLSFAAGVISYAAGGSSAMAALPWLINVFGMRPLVFIGFGIGLWAARMVGR